MTHLFRALFALPLALALSACAISDVGEVDARKGLIHPAPAGTAPPGGTYLVANETPLGDLRPERGGACTLPSGPDAASPAGPARNLVGLGRPRQAASVLRKDDMVSIRLRRVFISDHGYAPENVLTDLDLSAEGLGETARYFGDGFNHNYEILVAARVIDYANAKDGGDASVGGQGGFSFGAPGRADSRVIYFSDDVEEGQVLSEDNLPVYGPRPYGGAGFGLQLFILEVDEASEQQKELLTSLAAVGQQAAGAPAPVVDVISQVVEGLLDNGNADDRMFDYAIGFDTGFEGASVAYVPFEENIYAFVIDHDRRRGVPWERMALNEETAELFICGGAGAAGGAGQWRHFTGGTYMVVQVLKGLSGQPAETLTFAETAAFRQALIEARAGGPAKVSAAIDQAAATIGANALFDLGRDHLAALREGVAAQDLNRIKRALFKLSALLIDHNASAAPADGKLLLSDRQMEYLVETLYDLTICPVPTNAQDAFTPAAFKGEAKLRAAALEGFYVKSATCT